MLNCHKNYFNVLFIQSQKFFLIYTQDMMMKINDDQYRTKQVSGDTTPNYHLAKCHYAKYDLAKYITTTATTPNAISPNFATCKLTL